MKRLIIISYLFFSILFSSIDVVGFVENKALSNDESFSLLPLMKLFEELSPSQEGLCADTLVKTDCGYKPVKTIRHGDIVIAPDNREKQVIAIMIKFVKRYVLMVINDTITYVGYDQHYCVLPEYNWIPAKDIKRGDILLNNTNEDSNVTHIELVEENTALYSFTVEDHIFCIAPCDVCVHNSEALVASAAGICLGQIVVINPIVATIGTTVALSTVAYRAYQNYNKQCFNNAQECAPPTNVLLAERSYYQERKTALETIKQEFVCIKNDLSNIKVLCNAGSTSFTYQFLQQSITPQVQNQNQQLKISAASEMQLSESQKIDLRQLREIELKVLEQEIIDLQYVLACHTNELVEQVQSAHHDYENVQEYISAATNLWNNNLNKLTYPIALQSYQADCFEEFLLNNLTQKIDELKAVAYYYRNCGNSIGTKQSTNIIELLEKNVSLIAQYDQWIPQAKARIAQKISISEQHFARQGISIVGIRNETKNALEKWRKDRAAQVVAEARNKLSNMASSGGPNKYPKKDNEPEKDPNKNERKINTVSKSEFLKNGGKDYQHWRGNTYKRKPGTKGIEGAEYIEWDNLHNDVEAYGKNEHHLGSIDPKTLRLYKGPVYPRRISK